jgi:CheY-like chemotaxis protein
MEKLKEFVKSLNILYVEDELQAREISQKIFKRIFKNVDSFENGLEGFLAFQSNKNNYDLIISDINMPKMDGIDMLEKIREVDTEIPVIFITARNESNVLLKSIELGVVNYLIKPLDMETMTKVVYKTCEKIYLKSSLMQKQSELEVYLKTIEQITYITKINKLNKITYINDNFCDLLGKSSDEYIDKDFTTIIDSSVSAEIIDDIKEKFKEGKIWEGTLKSIDKNNDLIYLKTIYMPIYDLNNKDVLEYLAIRYQVTDEEKEKKELNKKIIQNIVQFKKKAYSISEDNKKSHEEIVELKKYISTLNLRIEELENNKKALLNQLESYEKSQLNNQSGRLNLIKQKNEEIENLLKLIKHLKHEKNELFEKIELCNETLDHNKNTIDIYKNNELRLNEKITNLEDVINDLESKLGSSNKKSFFS